MLHVNFATLRQILLDLGFAESVEMESRCWFIHPSPKTRIMLPILRQDEMVDLGDLVIIRRTLDERGILSREKFEQLLAEKAVAV